jgi:hypothetical protein
MSLKMKMTMTLHVTRGKAHVIVVVVVSEEYSKTEVASHVPPFYDSRLATYLHGHYHSKT